MIRTIALLAVAATGLSLPAVAPAGAESPVPSPIANGRRCSFTSVTDVTAEGEVQVGQINGGVLVAASVGVSISITCTIQVGASASVHAGVDACSASNGPLLQAVLLPPTLCSYNSPAGQPVYLCTEINVNGSVYYWDATPKSPPDPTNPETQVGWTTNVNAPCNEAISQEIFPGPLAPVLEEIDGEICPILGDLAPGAGVVYITPEGDVYVNGEWIWDCPTYGNGPDPHAPRICVVTDHRPIWYFDTCDPDGPAGR